MKHTSKNQEQIARNEAEMLRLIRAKRGLSPAQISRRMNMAPSTVGIYVTRLKKEGYLTDGEKHEVEGPGRPARDVVINPDAGTFVGVDITNRFVRMIRMDFAEEVLQEEREEIQQGRSFDRVMNRIVRLARSNKGDPPVLGAGVVVPSPVPDQHLTRGTWRHLREWNLNTVDVVFREEFDVPVHHDTSHRAMAAAELWFGQGRDVDNFVSLSARTGIGAIPVLDGEPLRGVNDKAGNIGYWKCPPHLLPRPLSGREESKGLALAELCSIPGFLDQVEQNRAEVPDSVLSEVRGEMMFGDVLNALRERDGLATQHRDAAGVALGWAAARLNELLDPELFVLSGSIIALGGGFVEVVRDTLASQVGPDRTAVPHFAITELGEHAGAIGAAAVALHHWKPDR
ncbi:MAG: ROK family transcriptional regulator [Planctomycetota bacterium]